MSHNAQSNAASKPNTATFQILARRPMQATSTGTSEAQVRQADPLRETLPWPLPEGFQEQLAAGCDSIRETVAGVQ